MNLITITTNKNSDNQRTTSQTKLYWYRHARNCYWEHTEDKSDEDTNEDGCDVWCIQAADRVTHLACYIVNSILRTNNHDAVANLQRQSRRCEDVHSVTCYASYVNTVDAREVQRCKCLTVYLRIGNNNTLRNHWLILLLEVDVELRSDKGSDSLLIGLGTNNQHLIAKVEDSIAVRDKQLTLVNQTRYYEVTIQEVVNLQQSLSLQIFICYLKVHLVRLLVCICLVECLQVSLFLLEFYLTYIPY